VVLSALLLGHRSSVNGCRRRPRGADSHSLR
jgi:hypothetical protein